MNSFKQDFKSLYTELLDSIAPFKQDLYPFAMQWGPKYHQTPQGKPRLLFVGKATNGWVTNSRDIDVLFGDPDEETTIWERSCQMLWADDRSQGHNVNKSAFWRVIRRVAQPWFGAEWLHHIAWSNLYKVSFRKGNPSGQLQDAQREVCIRILEAELKALQPTHVCFLTSGWEVPFIRALGAYEQREIAQKLKWGTKHHSHLHTMPNRKIITSFHPQGKQEAPHAAAISKFINTGFYGQSN